ncbi:SDR family NAD(P)-dependent oxidoreductase [Aneurinibacillus migulanus]|uniref:3-oxoacyl-[acyl-carrier protein] reductase n=1 Tax=Aneurinibacillus migulanus TaxID=47500 RepID=A0A0D1VFC7_ANEMI|nr:SDR family oxidoreductase [Aneurinibacillus migulanus]KIV58174.1 short-chain dehydrogenase [Aneurinibacillus migulanus]KON96952.1 short-chain dehydrogenase [Aneurinibacillus migulanus]MED0896245.1 SDR family oxidoreductase [Aneurinibacillus migulanus]MED1618085.1 SDR family oxidoreductase [Aneurinibacillus migulanus]SDJ60466.1 3-oxoacyl-[acyl-carrier protein] reductase [Aneurinibacillus migulanus]
MNGKVAIVTGASRGIGAATAKTLAGRGAKVVVNYARNATAAEEVVASIKEKDGEAIAIQADARNVEQMNNLVEETVKTYGTVDILVHNAGMSFVKKSFEDMSWDEFIQKTNDELQAAFVSTKVVLPYMKKQNYGKLVYVSSGLSNHPGPNFISHGTSKGALNSFVRYIAQELGSQGITANVVSPGLVETDATASIPEGFKQQQAAFLPLGRIGQPKDIAKAIAFYASDDSAYLTGSYLPVSGGGEMN